MDEPIYRALLIGNSRFPEDPHNLTDLHGPPNDLIALRAALTDAESGLFAEEHVQVLADQPKRTVTMTMEQFFRDASRDDQLLLYYSGHGKQDIYNRLYLCASDTSSDLLVSTGISDTEINGMMQRSAAQTLIVVLDCCHSGTFKGSGLPTNLRGRGRFIITSCQSGQSSHDAAGEGETSPFSRYLIEGLLGGTVDVNGDGYVSLNEVYTYVLDALPRETGQIPQQDFDRVVGDPFIARRRLISQTSTETAAPAIERHLLPPDPLWYRKAVIYRAIIESFFDYNGDGIGDVRGLQKKLDYLRGLGIDAVWTSSLQSLPTDPTTMQYEHLVSVNPRLGERDDVIEFVDRAHCLGLRVVCDLALPYQPADSPGLQIRSVQAIVDFWSEFGFDGFGVDPLSLEPSALSASSDAYLAAIRSCLSDDKLIIAREPSPAEGLTGPGASGTLVLKPLLGGVLFASLGQSSRAAPLVVRSFGKLDKEVCAFFLRDERELRLDALDDSSCDYLLGRARDNRAIFNDGIRRRLAPLVDNDRITLELLYSLLFSLPGSPILYYGDEIGMGDSLARPGLRGLRTPMQWTGDRNAGFSPAATIPEPPIQSAIFGYKARNVEAAGVDRNSLLWWIKSMLEVRKRYAEVFGMGSFEVVAGETGSVLAFVRRYEATNILCVYNLSSTFQWAALSLEAYAECIPFEMLGRVPFPRIGLLPYLITLPRHGVYWFELLTQGRITEILTELQSAYDDVSRRWQESDADPKVSREEVEKLNTERAELAGRIYWFRSVWMGPAGKAMPGSESARRRRRGRRGE